ncbi:hypothetical protein Tco_0626814 [Tanacetum coccineum]|uniref:Uncharacterized protein n=1 Tax=Tanacetum coccineum TaxID=301880 RepID=A0ABQ4WKR3_9ASTR
MSYFITKSSDVVVVVSNVSFEAFNLGVKKRFQKEFRLAPSAGRGGQLLEVTCGISRNIRAISTSSQTNNERGRSFLEILERLLEQVARAHRKQRSQTDVAQRIQVPGPRQYAREDLQRGCQVQAFVNDARSTFLLYINSLHSRFQVYMIKVFYKGYSTFEANPFVPIDVLGSMVHVLMLDTLELKLLRSRRALCMDGSIGSADSVTIEGCLTILLELMVVIMSWREKMVRDRCGWVLLKELWGYELDPLYVWYAPCGSYGTVKLVLPAERLFIAWCANRYSKNWSSFLYFSVDSASVLKDPLLSDNCVNVELLTLLDRHRTVIRRYPETFLCLIGLRWSFDDIHVCPTLLKSDESDMGLFNFVKSADLFKVKTWERTLAEGEVPLNDETHAGKKKNRGVFDDLPAKRLRTDAAVATEVVPTTGGKSPTALKRLELQSGPQGVGSSSVPPFAEDFVSSSITPTPEPDVPEDSSSTQDGGVRTHHASMGIVMSSDDDVASPRVEPLAGTGTWLRLLLGTVETATADNIYVPEWGVTNGAQIDNPAICRNLLDRVTPPGYWAALRNQSVAGFLDAFNINYAQHTYMVSDLRLRYEHEIMTREKFQKKFTDNCVVIQQCDVEIADLKNRLEKAEHEATEVVVLHGHVSELEAGMAVKSGEVYTLTKQNAELLGKCLRHEVAGESKLREEFKSFQDAAEQNFEERANALDARIADVRRDMDNDLYLHMLTAIARWRWVVLHGFCLVVYKCARSVEFRSALGKVISMAINKGIQQGLEAGVVHGGAGRSLSQIEAYDPDTEGKYVAAEDVHCLATLVRSFKLIDVCIEHHVTALDCYIRPPWFRTTIEHISDEPGSIAANRTKKILLLTWHKSSEPTKEHVCDFVTPSSLPQHDSSTLCKVSVCDSITPRCMPNCILTPPTDESVVTYAQLSGVHGVIDDVIRQLSFEETELDGEAGFADVAGSGVESSRLSHDESFGVDDLDFNLNKPVNLNGSQIETQSKLFVFEEPDVGRSHEPIVVEVSTQEPIVAEVRNQIPIVEEVGTQEFTVEDVVLEDYDLHSDDVKDLAMASGRGRPKDDLELSTWRRRQDFKATSSHHESIYDVWTRFKSLIQRVPHHGLDLWPLTQFFYDHVDDYTRIDLDFATDLNLRELSGEEAWEAIENFAQGQKEWENPPGIIFEQEVANLKAQAKRLFENENVLVEMHRGIAWDMVENPNPQRLPIEGIPSFDEPDPQPQPLPSFPSLEVDLGEERDPEPPIKLTT